MSTDEELAEIERDEADDEVERMKAKVENQTNHLAAAKQALATARARAKAAGA